MGALALPGISEAERRRQLSVSSDSPSRASRAGSGIGVGEGEVRRFGGSFGNPVSRKAVCLNLGVEGSCLLSTWPCLRSSAPAVPPSLGARCIKGSHRNSAWPGVTPQSWQGLVLPPAESSRSPSGSCPVCPAGRFRPESPSGWLFLSQRGARSVGRCLSVGLPADSSFRGARPLLSAVGVHGEGLYAWTGFEHHENA